MKVQLGLYYFKTNSYIKFQVNITKDGRENPENLIFAKGNISIINRSNTIKFKLDLYDVKTNYMKFQVNISKDD